MKGLSYRETMGIGLLTLLAVAMGISFRQFEPGANASHPLEQRCDWEACATYLCDLGGRCAQLTAYRY